LPDIFKQITYVTIKLMLWDPYQKWFIIRELERLTTIVSVPERDIISCNWKLAELVIKLYNRIIIITKLLSRLSEIHNVYTSNQSPDLTFSAKFITDSRLTSNDLWNAQKMFTFIIHNQFNCKPTAHISYSSCN